MGPFGYKCPSSPGASYNYQYRGAFADRNVAKAMARRSPVLQSRFRLSKVTRRVSPQYTPPLLAHRIWFLLCCVNSRMQDCRKLAVPDPSPCIHSDPPSSTARKSSGAPGTAGIRRPPTTVILQCH